MSDGGRYLRRISNSGFPRAQSFIEREKFKDVLINDKIRLFVLTLVIVTEVNILILRIL